MLLGIFIAAIVGTALGIASKPGVRLVSIHRPAAKDGSGVGSATITNLGYSTARIYLRSTGCNQAPIETKFDIRPLQSMTFPILFASIGRGRPIATVFWSYGQTLEQINVKGDIS